MPAPIVIPVRQRCACGRPKEAKAQTCRICWLVKPKKADLASRFWEKVDKTENCWIWTAAVDRKGYGKLGMRIDGKPRTVQAHRVAYQMLVGPIPDGMVLCHRCDNPPCVNPTHLFVGTIADNMRDMARKGRFSRSQAKLTPELVREIRSRYIPRRVSLTMLAAQYGVSFQLISLVVNRRIWQDVA